MREEQWWWRPGREEWSRQGRGTCGLWSGEMREDQGAGGWTSVVTVAHLVTAFVTILVLMEFAAPARQCTTRR